MGSRADEGAFLLICLSQLWSPDLVMLASVAKRVISMAGSGVQKFDSFNQEGNLILSFDSSLKGVNSDARF